MCLVSYIPLENNNYCITSNRDEAPVRAAYQIMQEQVNAQTIYYPADTLGGSWIIRSSSRRSICLLNGAFDRHERQLPYRLSRGLVMKQFFEYENAVDFLEAYDLHRIEPFTMVIAEPNYLFELRWDGEVKHINSLARSEIYVWSSCTLYSKDAIARRKEWFFTEIAQAGELSPSKIVQVHMAGGEKDRSIGFLMNWGDRVRTISISQITDQPVSELLHIPLEDKTVEPIRQIIHG